MAESETGIEGDPHRIRSMLKGKQLMDVQRDHEWDLNNWRWNGHLFIAKPSNSNTPTNDFRLSNPSDLNELANAVGNGITTLEKRRKVLVDGEFTLADEPLSLNIGGGDTNHLTPWLENGKSEGKDGKGSKPPLAVSSHPTCQVDGCKTDLQDAKDYHRRHKVCEVHSKSTTVSLGGVTQRFCQQCSRFHMLQEFDEGKRSCRRRLAGHNRRRRKMNMQSVSGANPISNEHVNKYILISVLKILLAMHSSKSDQKNDEDILFQLLKMLAGSGNASSQAELLRVVQLLLSPQSVESSNGISSQALHDLLSSSLRCATASGSSGLLESANATAITIQDSAVMNGNQSGHLNLRAAGEPQIFHVGNHLDRQCPVKQKQLDATQNNSGGERIDGKLNDFDLNDIYMESQDEEDELDKSSPTTSSEKLGARIHSGTNGHTSPPPLCGNSDSSDKSPSSSSAELQCCTERIIFKLFGKDPSDIPYVLRSQILSWLSQSPTDIESYIRPGCIVLTIYVRLPRRIWEELSRNLVARLKRLLEDSNDIFWTTGWICAKIGHQLAFIYNGQVLLDRSFFLSYEDAPMILSFRPIAVSLCEQATFTVKGTNLTSGIKRLCCAFQGKQLIHEHASAPCCDTDLSADSFDCDEEIQFFNFTCSFPNISGRGFVEIEDEELNTGFLPFIVAEKDICSEICMLEGLLEDDDVVPENTKERDEALEFLHEFGWLLERFRSAYDTEPPKHEAAHLSHLKIKWLLKFCVEHDWRCVLKKLLDILYDKKIGLSNFCIQELLDEVDLLHTAVKRKSGPMVKFLLNFTPNTQPPLSSPVFRVDKKGPAGVTPLHIAASIGGAQAVIDILTTGPEELWLYTWENERDETGFTPKGYALQRGHDNYIQLIWQKKNKKYAGEHVIIDLSNASAPSRIAPETLINENKQKSYGLHIDASRPDQHPCKLCEHQSFYRTGRYRALNYRPAILSMVAIAAVCVCVGILFKSPPEVIFVMPPFRWDALDYGYI